MPVEDYGWSRKWKGRRELPAQPQRVGERAFILHYIWFIPCGSFPTSGEQKDFTILVSV